MATMRFMPALEAFQDRLQRIRDQLYAAEEAVTLALLNGIPEERARLVEAAKIAATINEGGDLRMFVVELFEDEP